MDCSKVITIKQDWSNCWFVAILMVIFYSQGSRKILEDHYKKRHSSEHDDNKRLILEIFKYIFHSKYIKKTNNDYYFVRDKDILTLLHNYNKTLFEFNPSKSKGYDPYRYLHKIYDFIGISQLSLKMCKDNIILYDFFKYDTEYLKDVKKISPSVIIIDYDNEKNYSHEIEDYFYVNNLFFSYDELNYNGVVYTLDAIILRNYNINKYYGHAIAGITCDDEKYIYNGRGLLRNFNFSPCDLMKYDWNITDDKPFCLNRLYCGIHKSNKMEFCFSFAKGRRLMIYTKKSEVELKTGGRKQRKLKIYNI